MFSPTDDRRSQNRMRVTIERADSWVDDAYWTWVRADHLRSRLWAAQEQLIATVPSGLCLLDCVY